jgi:hypothetical protein
MLEGPEMFRAGLYVGLGSLGNEAASCVFRGSFGGCENVPKGGGGIVRGPSGRPMKLKSAGDGIFTERS